MGNILSKITSIQGIVLFILIAVGYFVVPDLGMASEYVFIIAAILGFVIAASSGSASKKSPARKKQAHSNNSADNTAADGDTTTLYVGNLAYRSSEGDVKTLFSEYGNVSSVRIMFDRATRRAKGYCFVEMDPQGASSAMSELNGYEFNGRELKVSEANARQR